MEKNYPKYLREWVKRKESSRKAQNMVAFLAVSADVKAALDVGYAVSTITCARRDASPSATTPS